MPVDRFAQSYRVGAPPARVYAHLLEPQSYVGLSPLVVEVRDVRPVRDDRGRAATAYVAVERFRFGPLRWDNAIRVTMTGVGPHEQVISAVVSPGWVRLFSTVTLTADGDGTRMDEAIELHTPWPLRRFALGEAQKVQRGRAAELARRMRE